jgi:hypothetical protein
MPFSAFPALQSVERRLRIHLPDSAVMEELLRVFHGEIGDAVMFAFTREYVQQTVIPRALHGEGRFALAALSTLYALMGIGALFMVPGPGEAPQVGHYGNISVVAFGAIGCLATPFLESVECAYARCFLELLRQGPLEEPIRSAFALCCQRCYIVSDRLEVVATIHIDHQNTAWSS